MDILRLEAGDDLVPAVVELLNAAAAADAPWQHPVLLDELRARLRYGWELDPAPSFAAVRDGHAVAFGAVHYSDWDNADLGWLQLTVHPAHRGQGHGAAMYDALLAQAHRMSKTKLGCDAWDGNPGIGFARSRGFVEASRAIARRQHLDELARDDLTRWHDEAAAAAASYELVRLVGRTPEQLLPQMSAMVESINDAPLDDLDIEDEVFPPERIRAYEEATERRGMRLYRLLARDRTTGELAGHTVVAVESERPEVGHQHDTTVVRRHRGHRLGLLLKSGMNLWLADVEPQLRTIDTWNAESNDHMIGVNELLGYRWMGREVEMQQRAEPRR